MVKNREEVMENVRQNRDAIRKYGVRRLALFGSFARAHNRAASDLDFLVEFEKKTFDNYMGLKLFLEELFGCKVDLVLFNTLKPRLRNTILNETMYAPGF